MRVKDLEAKVVHRAYDGDRNWEIREIHETNDIESLVRTLVKTIDLWEGVFIYNTTGQIRLEPTYYKNLKPDVIDSLWYESVKPDVNYLKRSFKAEVYEVYVNERYWSLCDRYIFDFKGLQVDIDIEWEYDGHTAEEYHKFFQFTHPFIGTFIEVYEHNINTDKAMKLWMVK